MSEVLLQIKNLKKHFSSGKKQVLKAVDDVSFDIYKGETLGLVGESGCGKSTLGRTILRLYAPTSGSILYDGKDINAKMNAAESKALNRKMQMVFQDPYASLDQRMKVLDIIAEGIDAHGLAANAVQRKEIVINLLNTVGLQEEHAYRFPHEFSGGQRQRVGIARALAVNPEFLVADEPISALDVSIQAQIVNLLKKLQNERRMTYLFIAHDISMVKYISDRIGVMYLGALVELADSETIFKEPLHPYTQALLSAIPVPDPKIEKSRERIVLGGSVGSPIDLPQGCRFCNRCGQATPKCKTSAPHYQEVKPGHWVSCNLYEKSK